jgi:molybdenum cofactor biosynthesis protein B
MNQNHVKQLEVRCAIITVSSTRTTENDMSGIAIRKILSDAGMPVRFYAIVHDRIEAIRDQVYRAMKETNCIILNGGTGLTFDDCTIEAVSPREKN